jgi:hypothetical protein
MENGNASTLSRLTAARVTFPAFYILHFSFFIDEVVVALGACAGRSVRPQPAVARS